jgi:hypothetical protein
MLISYNTSRPQWPSDLSHELSSLARTLGSWVRIPLQVWMYVCVYSVSVKVAALRRADPRPRSPTDCLRIKKLK